MDLATRTSTSSPSAVQKSLVRLNEVRPENFFALTAITFGLCLSFLTAPLQSPDEPAHFFRIWQISSGQMASEHYGGRVPDSVIDLCKPFAPLCFHPDHKTTLGAIFQEFHRPLRPSNQRAAIFGNTAILSPVSYIPQASMMAIGRLFSAPPIVLMYMARIGTASAYAAIGWLTIRTLPILKWPACMVLLSPLPIFLAGSLSADSMTTVVTFLITAQILKMIALRTHVPRGGLAFFGASVIAGALCKSTYFPVSLLMFSIPAEVWGTTRLRVLKPLVITALAILTLSIWSRISDPLHAPMLFSDATPQLRWIQAHPVRFLGVMIKSVLIHAKAILANSIGILGWNDTRLSHPFIGIYLLVIAVAVITDVGDMRIARNTRLIAVLAVVCSMSLIMTWEYLVWTTVGHDQIDGINGRYVIPLALVAFVAIRRVGGRRIPPVALQFFIVVSCCYTVGAVICRYYW